MEPLGVKYTDFSDDPTQVGNISNNRSGTSRTIDKLGTVCGNAIRYLEYTIKNRYHYFCNIPLQYMYT